MMDRLLENNTILKILSVIVAIFIWIQAGAASTQATTRPISPVAVVVPPTLNSHLTVLSIAPASVQVTVKGPPAAVGSTSMPSDVSASINLSKITKPGTYSLKVSGTVPTGIGVYSILPARVVVSVARFGQQKVPVVIHVAGQPTAGDLLSSYKSSLKQATISGPTGALNQVSEVVGTVQVGDRSSTFSASVVLHPVNAEGQTVPKVEVNPPTTRVRVAIQPKPPEKVLPIVGQIKGKPASGYSVSGITVYPSSVTVSGTKSVLSGLDHISTSAVDVSRATKNITVSVPVIVPKGATLVSSGEVTVTITITGSG